MSRVNLPDIAAQFASTAALNSRFDTIETFINDRALYRSNPEGDPNSMATDLDMGGNDIFNVNKLSVQTIELIGDAIVSAASTSFDPTSTTLVATNVQAAIEELEDDYIANDVTQQVEIDTNVSDISILQSQVAGLDAATSDEGVASELSVLRRSNTSWATYYAAGAGSIDLGSVAFTGFIRENLGVSRMDFIEESASYDFGVIV